MNIFEPSPPTIRMRSVSQLVAIAKPIRMASDSVPCIAALLLADDEREHAEEWAKGRMYFGQHLVPRFRLPGAAATQVISAFCPTCWHLRSGAEPEVIAQWPWAVDVKGRSQPVDSLGPLSARPAGRAVVPMPTDWQPQAEIVFDAIEAAGLHHRRTPTVPIDRIANGVSDRLGCGIPHGIIVAGAAAAGINFVTSRDGSRVKLAFDEREIPSLVDAISERLCAPNG